MIRIAVINNDTDFLTLMSDVLESRGWATTICREGKEAFAVVRQQPPDLIVLDIRMETPETGWNVLELIKLDPHTSSIPVVVCSADALALRAKESWLHDRGIDTLLKPFDIDDLFAAVEKGLGSARNSAKPHADFTR